jgi:di/tricarboxylate transporter
VKITFRETVLIDRRIAATIAAPFALPTPKGCQASAMAYGPGGFRFRDFTRLDVPLQLILMLLSIGFTH